MFAFEISVNGKRLVLAGIEDWDLIHADIMAKRAAGDEPKDLFE